MRRFDAFGVFDRIGVFDRMVVMEKRWFGASPIRDSSLRISPSQSRAAARETEPIRRAPAPFASGKTR
jgi:hypothetical protein